MLQHMVAQDVTSYFLELLAVGSKNYGGFENPDSWPKRTTIEHREQMSETLDCTTGQDREKLESEYGTRFSVLAELPHFDTVRMSIVDPMHNLYLGTVKNILKIWKERGYLQKNELEQLLEKVDEFVVPCDIGKIPKKIVSSFDGFTSDEYQSWTILFSIYCLKDTVPVPDIKCLRKFGLACQYLSRHIISKRDVTVADTLLQQFCLSCENLYGEDRVAPSMHLHCHLKECIFDFGPIYSFWLFSFERYNGILGSLHNNNKDIECQILQRQCSIEPY